MLNNRTSNRTHENNNNKNYICFITIELHVQKYNFNFVVIVNLHNVIYNLLLTKYICFKP